MTTRFFTQDCREQLDVDELTAAINEVGADGKQVKALQWDTRSDFYGVAITTDREMTAEQAGALYHSWLESDFDPEVLEA